MPFESRVAYEDENVDYDQSSVTYDGLVPIFIKTKKSNLIKHTLVSRAKEAEIVKHKEFIVGGFSAKTPSGEAVIIKTKKETIHTPKQPHDAKTKPYEEKEFIVDP